MSVADAVVETEESLGVSASFGPCSELYSATISVRTLVNPATAFLRYDSELVAVTGVLLVSLLMDDLRLRRPLLVESIRWRGTNFNIEEVTWVRK